MVLKSIPARVCCDQSLSINVLTGTMMEMLNMKKICKRWSSYVAHLMGFLAFFQSCCQLKEAMHGALGISPKMPRKAQDSGM